MLLLNQLAQWNQLSLITLINSTCIYRQSAVLAAVDGEIHLQLRTQLPKHLNTCEHAACSALNYMDQKCNNQNANLSFAYFVLSRQPCDCELMFSLHDSKPGGDSQTDTSLLTLVWQNCMDHLHKGSKVNCCAVSLPQSGYVAGTAQHYPHQCIYCNTASSLRGGLTMRWP